MNSKGERQSKISLKENGVVSFDSKKNAYTFCRFFSNLADSILQKFTQKKHVQKKRFGIKTTGGYYEQI